MKKVILSSILGIILLVSFVSAFGVSSPYWTDNPLKMYPGQSITVDLNLQNKAGATEDVTASVALIEGTEIASLDDGEYEIKAGEDINVPLKVKISKETQVGTTYKIQVEVKTVTPGEGGGVVMGTGMNTEFDVEVIEKPAGVKEGLSVLAYIIIAIIIILVIAALYFLLRNRE